MTGVGVSEHNFYRVIRETTLKKGQASQDGNAMRTMQESRGLYPRESDKALRQNRAWCVWRTKGSLCGQRVIGER